MGVDQLLLIDDGGLDLALRLDDPQPMQCQCGLSGFGSQGKLASGQNPVPGFLKKRHVNRQPTSQMIWDSIHPLGLSVMLGRVQYMSFSATGRA